MLEECGFGSEATVLAVVENTLQTGQVCQGSTGAIAEDLNAAENAPVMRLAKELASQPVQGVGDITRLCKTGSVLGSQGGSQGRLLIWQALDHVGCGFLTFDTQHEYTRSVRETDL